MRQAPQMPWFLNIAASMRSHLASDLDAHLEGYRTLLGIWLIDMSFNLKWIERPPSGSLARFFANDDFTETTGLPQLHALLRPAADEDEPEEDEDVLIDFDDSSFDDAPKMRTRPSRRKSSAQPHSQAALRRKLTELLKRRRAELVTLGIRTDLPLFQNIERIGRLPLVLAASAASKALFPVIAPPPPTRAWPACWPL